MSVKPHISKHTFGYHVHAPGTNITVIYENYDILCTDSVILVNAAPTTVKLDTNESTFPIGKIITIKDITGNASVNNITLSGATIDGGFSVIDWDYGSVVLIFYAAGQWYILAKY